MSLTSRQREELYDRCRGEAEFPTCNICGGLILKGQRWHESHDPLLPRAAGGEVTGIAHERCNLDHNHAHDTPLVAKMKRLRQRDIGAYVKPPSSRPLPGSRRSGIKLPFNGPPIDRRTGQPWRGWR
jgi:hypothetical protein